MVDSDIPRYAVIPTHSRPAELHRIVDALGAQVNEIIIVDNASNPPVTRYTTSTNEPPFRLTTGCVVWCHYDDEQPPNLPRLWNVGVDIAARRASDGGHSRWWLGIFNDDAVVPVGWFDAVTEAVERTGAVAGSGDTYGVLSSELVKHQVDRNLMTRMCPWAFVTRGEVGIRGDEELRWWWQDTDFEWRAISHGGVVMVPGFKVENTGANSSTNGELMAQTLRDRQAFERKWGYVPW